MTATTATKVKEKPVEPTELELAGDEYFPLRAERKALINQCDHMQATLQLSSMPEPLPLRSVIAIEAAGEDLAIARRNPRRFELKLFELRDRLDDLNAPFEQARERYERACSSEARRIAEELVPRHRAAVASIHASLIQLSNALAEEVGIHDEFGAKSPTAWPSQLLPNMSGVFKKAAWLSHYDSIGSIWVREARAKGLIE